MTNHTSRVSFLGRLNTFDRPQRCGDPAAKLALQRILPDELNHRRSYVPAAHVVEPGGLDTRSVRITRHPSPGLVSVLGHNLPHVIDYRSAPTDITAPPEVQSLLASNYHHSNRQVRSQLTNIRGQNSRTKPRDPVGTAGDVAPKRVTRRR